MKKVLLLVMLSFSLALFTAACKPKDPDKDNEKPITYYTVTYSGTDLAPTEYESGATVAKPADPTSAGKVFVGWYTDANYDTQYTFGTAITGDVTLYARFVTPADPEFTVTYVSDGTEIASAQMIGNMALNAPVPSKDGHTFIGWWVSDYEDADKLTYRYDEQVLGADTTLYAVWDEAPVSVSATTISWGEKGATASYTIEITKDGKAVDTHRVTGGNTYAYDFSKLDAGDYVVSVSVNGSTSTAYYKNKALDRVSCFEVIDGGVLMFNAVDNATNYYITVDCGNAEHKHVLYDNGRKITYDFSDCSMQQGGIAFTVTAKASGFADSVSKTFYYEANLGAVTELKVDAATAVLSWADVDNAEYYIVEISGDVYTVTDNTYSLKYYGAGNYNIRVTAAAHGYNASNATLSYQKTGIAAPADVQLHGNTVSWSAVNGATAYKVSVNGTEYDVTGTQYTLEAISDTATVAVQAIKSGASSVYSDALTVTKTLSGLTYSEGVASWAAVLGADKYRVSVNGGPAVEVTDNFCDVTLTRKGANTLSVTSVTGTAESAALSITVDAYEITFSTEGGTALEPVYLAAGDKLSDSCVSTKYGYTLSSWYSTNNPENGRKIDLNTYRVNKDATLFAKWAPKTLTLVLDVANGGTVESTEFEVVFGEEFSLPVPVSADELKVFAGWYSDANAEGSRYTDENGDSLNVWAIDRDRMTLVAGWLNVLSYNPVNNGTAYSVSAGADIDKVTSVKIPATYNGLPVTTVEGSAFRNCLNLVSVSIPDTIQNVETGTAFLSCYALKYINIYETDEISVEQKLYYSIDGVLFYDNPNNEGREIKCFPQGRTGEYWIPDGVEVIPINVFRAAMITELHVPASVVKIDQNAFSSYTVQEIVFENAAAGEQELPLDINSGAFGYCSALVSVTLPNRLRTFDPSCFENCYSLAEINMVGTGEYFAAVNGVLLSADGAEIVYCPQAKTSYVIPASVSVIGKNAFANTKFTSIVIPANVTKIDEYAFGDCTALKTIEFKGTSVQDGALTIESYAFFGCTSLTSVTLPPNLVTLKAYAFGDNRLLKSVTVNSGSNVQFELNAFFDESTGGSNLLELTIGPDFYCENVGGVFGGPDISRIVADPANPYYFTENNVLYSINKDEEKSLSIQYYPAGIRITDFVINDRVTSIGDRVFEGRMTLKSVTIPAKVTSIGAYAFKDCIGLESVTFAPRTADLTIGDYAFANCRALTEITIPASVVKMGEYDAGGNISSLKVFDSCYLLADITVESGNNSFASQDGILYGKNSQGVVDILYFCPAMNASETVTIPATVTEIFDNAFRGNQTVTTVNFEAQTLDKEFKIGRYAFAEMSALDTVNIPEGIEVIGIGIFMDSSISSFTCPNSVNSLGINSFKNCYNLTDFLFKPDRTIGISLADGTNDGDWWPAGLDEINGVFTGSAITAINLPENSTIGEYAFAYSSIESISIPEGMKSVKDFTFQDCSYLTSVELPDSIESIGEYAFYSCSSLTSIVIPDSCTAIGSSAFDSCRRLSSLDLGHGVQTIDRNAFDSLRGFTGTLVIPNSVTYIEEGAFSQSYMTKVIFEDDDETSTRERLILSSQFMGVFHYCQNLEEVVFPNMNGNIEVRVDSYSGASGAIFNGCYSLTTVFLGSGITTLANMFEDCPNITNLDGLLTNPSFVYEDGVLYNRSKTEIIMAIAGDFDVEDYRVPEDITAIHASAFQGIDCLKSVYIPKSVSSIGTQAFSECPNLETVTFDPNYTQDVEFGSGVFRGSYEYGSVLSNVSFPASFTTVGDYMFNRTAITSVTTEKFPGVDNIGDQAFSDCDHLETIDLSGNTNLRMFSMNDFSEEPHGGQYAFSYCPNLTTAILPESLNSIPLGLFSKCVNLAEFTIPSTVEEIGTSAFAETALTKVVIPDSVRYLSGASYSMGGAFANCPNLEEVYIGKDIYMIGGWDGGYVFYGCTNLKKVTIAGNPQYLAEELFGACPNLTEIIFTEDCGIEVIADNMFANLPITSMYLPESVTEIGAGAFSGCTELRTINIPEGLEFIGANAFKDCPLEGEMYIPGGVTTLGGGAFYGCTGITAFVVDMTNPLFTSDEYGIIYDLAGAIVAYPAGAAATEITIKPSVSNVRDYAFAGAVNLEKLYIPETVLTIGTGAFSGWTAEQALYFEVSMEDSVHYGNAWRVGCKALKYFSNGDELEPRGSYMDEDYDVADIDSTLAALGSENGYYIEYHYTYQPFPEWDPEYFSTSTYGLGQSGKYYTYNDDGYINIFDFDPSEEVNFSRYSGSDEDGWYKSVEEYDGNTPEEIIKSYGSDFFPILQAFTGFDEEMRKSEATFLGRECYVYTYEDGMNTYAFYFDKETGLCLKGNLMSGISWECTVFETSFEITPPTEFEEW